MFQVLSTSFASFCLLFSSHVWLLRSSCPRNCVSYYDGCNTCACDPATGFSLCTQRACFPEAITDFVCYECESNFEWNDCGSNCWQQTTCNNTSGVLCDQSCVEQCQCPSDKPIYNQVYDECVSEDNCGLTKCPEYCAEYFDGCNTCECNDDGYADSCTEIACSNSTYEEPKCLDCERNLVWKTIDTGCNACWKEYTCDDRDGPDFCIQSCQAQCQCPSNRPIWCEARRRCIRRRECNRFYC